MPPGICLFGPYFSPPSFTPLGKLASHSKPASSLALVELPCKEAGPLCTRQVGSMLNHHLACPGKSSPPLDSPSGQLPGMGGMGAFNLFSAFRNFQIRPKCSQLMRNSFFYIGMIHYKRVSTFLSFLHMPRFLHTSEFPLCTYNLMPV